MYLYEDRHRNSVWGKQTRTACAWPNARKERKTMISELTERLLRDRTQRGSSINENWVRKSISIFLFFFFGKLKNESEKFCFQLFGKLHFTRNLDLLENRKINSLNFHFHYFKNKSKNLHFYEKKNWILKNGLLQSFSIFSKNEIMKMN